MSPASGLTRQEMATLRDVQAITEALYGNPVALIEAATTTLARISRVAVSATPAMRLRLHDELALVNTVLDRFEPHNALPAPTRRAFPPFRGGRLSKTRRTG